MVNIVQLSAIQQLADSDVTVKVETLDGRSYPDMYGTGPLDNGNVTYGKVTNQLHSSVIPIILSVLLTKLYSKIVICALLLYPSVHICSISFCNYFYTNFSKNVSIVKMLD